VEFSINRLRLDEWLSVPLAKLKVIKGMLSVLAYYGNDFTSPLTYLPKDEEKQKKKKASSKP